MTAARFDVRTRLVADIATSVHIGSVNRFTRTLLFSLAAAPIMGACSTPSAAAVQSPIYVAPNSQIIGIHATGPQGDLDRLQAFATKSGFPSKQMDSPDGWELVVVFPPGSDVAAVAAFIDRLRGNEFSTLRFRSAIAPVNP